MKKNSDITFFNQNFGPCFFTPIQHKERLKEVLQNKAIVNLASIGDSAGEIASDQRVDKLFNEMLQSQDKFGLGFYEVYSNSGIFFGVAGYFFITHNNAIYPELCLYLLPEYQNKNLGNNIINTLADHAFANTNFSKIFADAFPNNKSTLILAKAGFVKRSVNEQFTPKAKQFGQVRYELTRANRGLHSLTEIIKKEGSNLIPRINDLVKANMERTRKLWYAYFHKGIPLSSGGIEDSFIQYNDFSSSKNLGKFNVYRSDRPESTSLSQEQMLNFIVAETAPNNKISIDELHCSFCFGSHEGLVRFARCIYNAHSNNGAFYPTGSYAFMAAALSTMKPTQYKVNLIKTDSINGGKINLIDLHNQIKLRPTCKTLFLELKTTGGAIYTADEMRCIIDICRDNRLFLIVDAAHMNMQFDENNAFPDVIGLCQKQGYHDFAMLYTGSKTYGLERARVGFVVISKKNRTDDLHFTIDRDLYRAIGSAGDISFEVANLLINSRIDERKKFVRTQAEKNRYNMNLMLAYIEGVKSNNIDHDLVQKIKLEMKPEYHSGIQGMSVAYKPKSGLQMKADVSGLCNKYYTNISMFNSEIFSYALNKVAGVVTLNSYQILEPNGFYMRLSFPSLDDVHHGMIAIHNFVKSLTDFPTTNIFMPEVKDISSLIFPNKDKVQMSLDASRNPVDHNFIRECKSNIRLYTPKYIKLNDTMINGILNDSASKIQKVWREHKPRSSPVMRAKL